MGNEKSKIVFVTFILVVHEGDWSADCLPLCLHIVQVLEVRMSKKATHLTYLDFFNWINPDGNDELENVAAKKVKFIFLAVFLFTLTVNKFVNAHFSSLWVKYFCSLF